MSFIDWMVLWVIGSIIGASAWYIYRSKKSGKKCIGCPYSGCCSSKNESNACSCHSDANQ